jgi:hypothetical protein
MGVHIRLDERIVVRRLMEGDFATIASIQHVIPRVGDSGWNISELPAEWGTVQVLSYFRF